jgi:hypothetical protein
LIVDPIADDGLGIQQSIADLLVDVVAREEPSQVSRLEWHVFVLHVLEDSLGIEDMEEVAGVISVAMEVVRQDLDWVEADWVVD